MYPIHIFTFVQVFSFLFKKKIISLSKLPYQPNSRKFERVTYIVTQVRSLSEKSTEKYDNGRGRGEKFDMQIEF